MMRTKKMAWILIAAVVSAVGYAGADTLINQNFDGDNIAKFINANKQLQYAYNQLIIGTYSSDATGAWGYATNNPGSSVVSTEQAYSGTQSMKVTRTIYGEGWVDGCTATAVSSGTLDVKFKVYRPDSNTASIVSVGERMSLGTASDISCGISMIGGDTLKINDNGAWTWVQNGDAILNGSVGEWMGFKMAIDVDAKTYDLYFSSDASDANMTLIYENAVISGWSSTSPNAILFLPSYAGGSTYVDDVVFSTIPEPATFGLLVMGTLAVIRRNKK